MRGARAEWLAAATLLLKGYLILSLRFKTPVGEIDIVARRGRRVVFVEVKQRPSMQMCEAAITPLTRQRVRRAAAWWMARNETYADFDQSFDLVFVTPWRLPRHLSDAL